METGDRSELLRGDLRRWGGMKRSLNVRRDPLVLAALEAGIAKEEIHALTGLGRSTIDRIEKGAVRSR